MPHTGGFFQTTLNEYLLVLFVASLYSCERCTTDPRPRSEISELLLGTFSQMPNISDRFCIQLRDVLPDAVVVPFTSILVNICTKLHLFATRLLLS